MIRKPRYGRTSKHPETAMRRLRLALGLSMHDAADRAGISYFHWQKLEYGLRRLTEDMIRQIALAFDVPAASLLERSLTLPIVGTGGPGLDAEVQLEPIDEVAPPVRGGNDATVAIGVAGARLGELQTEGWLVYFDDLRVAPSAQELGQTCVCGLPDGRVLIRTLAPAAARHRYHLGGIMGGATLVDQEVLWASRVRALVPWDQARRLVSGEASSLTQGAPFEVQDKPK